MEESAGSKSKWYGACEMFGCGWVGSDRDTHQEAKSDADVHKVSNEGHSTGVLMRP